MSYPLFSSPTLRALAYLEPYLMTVVAHDPRTRPFWIALCPLGWILAVTALIEQSYNPCKHVQTILINQFRRINLPPQPPLIRSPLTRSQEVFSHLRSALINGILLHLITYPSVFFDLPVSLTKDNSKAGSRCNQDNRVYRRYWYICTGPRHML